MYYSWEKIIKNCQYFVCIRVHSLYIILCGSTFGFNYISNSVWIGLHQHRTSGFHHFIPPFVQKSSNCEKTSSSQPIVGQFTDLLQIWSLSTDSIAIPGHWSYFFFLNHFLLQLAVWFGCFLYCQSFQFSGKMQRFAPKYLYIYLNCNLYWFSHVITECLALLKRSSPWHDAAATAEFIKG